MKVIYHRETRWYDSKWIIRMFIYVKALEKSQKEDFFGLKQDLDIFVARGNILSFLQGIIDKDKRQLKVLPPTEFVHGQKFAVKEFSDRPLITIIPTPDTG